MAFKACKELWNFVDNHLALRSFPIYSCMTVLVLQRKPVSVWFHNALYNNYNKMEVVMKAVCLHPWLHIDSAKLRLYCGSLV